MMDVKRALEAIRLSNRGRLSEDALYSLQCATYGFTGDAAARALHAALRRYEDLDDTLDDLHALVDQVHSTPTRPVNQYVNVRIEVLEKYLGNHRPLDLAASAKIHPKTITRLRKSGKCAVETARSLAIAMKIDFAELVADS